MKLSSRIFTLIVLISLLAVTVGITAQPASAAGPTVYTCFPTCSTTDGRFLALAGTGLQTLAGDTMIMEIAVPAGTTSFEIGIFDGDTGGMWDIGSTPTLYRVDDDPLGDGSGSTVAVAEISGAIMTDNSWYTLTIPTSDAAKSPSGNFFYHLHISNSDPTKNSQNAFKIRTSGNVEMAPEAFSFIGSLIGAADAKVIYPNYPTLSPTTYDGNWDMYAYVPSSSPTFSVWDGDLDYGAYDCSVNHTQDPETPASLPAFAVGTAALPDNGGPYTALNCKNATGQVITGPQGQVYTTGNPPDNNLGTLYTRTPSVNYDIILPDGTSYHNGNPSGNLVWNQFIISNNQADVPTNQPDAPGNKADYFHQGLLPSGVYHAHINGMDLHNLNAWRFNNYLLGVCDNGIPCAPILFPFNIGDTVWNDLNGNGIQDNGEPGLAGVTVSLLDTNSQVIKTTTTDATGQYLFNVDDGSYYVKVTPPTGYAFTTRFATGSTSANDSNIDTTSGVSDAVIINEANDMTIDAGLYQPVTIGNFVWNDLNGNGIQDAGEAGLPGVTVNLLGSDGATVAATTTSASDGSYSFSTAPGTYMVQFIQPIGYNFTAQSASGSTTANDSNPNPSTGLSNPITLTSGGTDNTIDAGLTQPATIGNFIWNDLNGNGIQDTGEPGISGVTVNLLGSDGTTVVSTTTTAPDGSYSFSTAPGTYSVQVTAPAGSSFTTKNASGSTSENDSNANPATGVSDAITLASGATDNSIDFGLYQPVTIGNFVWNDLNGNGIQDSGEPGISGVTVNLLGSDGKTIVATTTSALDGSYSFSTAPGTYSVQFVQPSGYNFTNQYADGSTPANDSNANVSTGISNAITLASGGSDNTIDAGLFQPVTIGNFIWNDLNGNGIQDSGEPGISGVTVNLLGSDGKTVVGTTTTDGNGSYSFSAALGTYSVQFVQPSGSTFTSKNATGSTSANDSNANPGTGLSDAVTLASGASDNTIDAGLYQPVTIGNFVWNDLNGNGIQDSGEPGISGVTVNLLGSDGKTVVGTTTTDGNGSYSFSATPGTYSVQFVQPSGSTFTTRNAAGSTTANDSNANIATGTSDAITLTSGSTDNTIDAGLYQPANLGNFVWNDLNGNGIQDSGEPGLAGVTVNLLNSAGSQINTTTSASDGSYAFTNLVPGIYSLQFNAPSEYTYTQYLQGGNPAQDSNANPANSGKTAKITLISGQNDTSWDAGLTVITYQIGDTVWNDANGNGIQNTGEAGVSGVTVKLLSSDGTTVIGSTTTDSSGKYSFTEPAGTYYVQFVSPAGFTFTTRTAAGSTTANDSNANTSTGLTDAINLTATDNTIDAGLKAITYQIGDTVWNDANGNGIQETGEAGVSGVTVKLLSSDGTTVIGSTTTDGSGKYSFTEPAGTYYVQFVSPAGFTFTAKNAAGSTTANDSNANTSSGMSDAINLTATDNTIDAGLKAIVIQTNYVIGDTVWNDANVNGIQDSGETGIQGVTVTLLGSNGTTVVGTTTTDSSGKYSFTQPAGTYYVKFSLPTGYNFTPKNAAGSTTANDSNANTSSGLTGVINLTATDNTIDAGLYQPASIGDKVWNDVNGNGLQDSGEAGLAGVTVKLLGSDGSTVISTTTTDANGKYSFTVAPGTYYVQFVAPGGYIYSQYLQGTNSALDSNANPANSGKSAAITILSGQSDTSWDAGLVAASCTTGSGTWNFNTLVGLLGSSQTYIVNGLTISAYGYTSPSTATALYGKNDAGDEHGLGIASDADHEIDTNHFIQLDLGQLQAAGVLNAKIQIGSMQTGEPAAIYGSNTRGSLGTLVGTLATTVDNTFVSIPGFPAYRYYSVKANAATPANVTLEAISFNCTPITYTIGDTVWKDTNGNGIQDTGEAGIPSVTVKLLGSDGTTVVNTTTTDTSGKYSFTVSAGTYYVQFVLPSGYTFTTKTAAGSTTANDSNANASTGITDPITVSGNDSSIDAGLKVQATSYTIGDFAWNDANGNGIQDTGETGIPGVAVSLLASNGTTVVGSTTTDANGKYSFTVPAGTYSVKFALPSGYFFSNQSAASSTAANDSNANTSTGLTGAVTITSASDLTIDAGMRQVLACAGNLVLNPSFEANTGTPPTNWSAGTSGNIGIPSPDGNNVGYITGSGIMSQGINVTAGKTYTLSFFSGSHNPLAQTVKMQYFTSANAAIGSAAVHTITSDLEVTGFGGPYSLSLGAAPSNAAYLKVMVSANNYDYAKVDAFCLQAQAPIQYSIGDFVWNDTNSNGIQDSGEAGIQGVAVTLLASDGTTVVANTATDASGKYSFTQPAGTYYVKFALPSGYTFTAKNAAGSTTANDSNANTATGITDAITVSGNDNTIDAGLIATVSQSKYQIGDFVWNDANSNGIQDTGETGIQGVTVTLLGSDGTTVISTTTTDANGAYSFSASAGTYFVKFSLPAGYSYTIKNAAGSTTANDSNASSSTGVTDAIVVSASDNTIDAGLKPTVNYCAAIRTPGFWKNYANHMSDATFLSLIQHTQDFSTLTIAQAVTILGTNNGITNLGIPALDGTDATYLKFLLTSEINAIWNGQDNAAGLSGFLGTGTYQGTGMIVNALLHQAYLDRKACTTNETNWVIYLGSGGENVAANACLVQP